MKRKMWNGIKPRIWCSKLIPPWTDHVYDRFKEQNPCCALSFKYQHAKTPWSRKKNLPYLHIKAVCIFPTCPAKYTFTMQNNPGALGKCDVKMLVQQSGEIHHPLSEKKARPATNLKRGKIAKALTHGPSQYFYSALQTSQRGGDASERREVLGECILQFGKYQGKAFRWLLENDMGYTIYLMKTLHKEEAAGDFIAKGHSKNSLMSFVSYAHSFEEIESLLGYVTRTAAAPAASSEDDQLVGFGARAKSPWQEIWKSRSDGYASFVLGQTVSQGLGCTSCSNTCGNSSSSSSSLPVHLYLHQVP